MLRKAQNWVTHPVDAGDARTVEGHFFLQHPARGLDHHADDLVLDQGWIHGQAAVERAKKVLRNDVAGPTVDFNFGDGGSVRNMVGPYCDPTAGHYLAIGQAGSRHLRTPARSLRRSVKYAEPSRVAHVPASEIEWIHLHRVRKLVDRLLRGE